MGRLKSGTIVTSPVSGHRYRIAEILGEGGFGCAYRAHRLDSRDRRLEAFCLKTTTHSQSWHREAYFGELLKKCDRAIRMHEAFPLFPNPKRPEVLYCLVSELVESGTVHDLLSETRRPWSQKRAGPEIIALLKLLGQLHGAGAVHRDITPKNVFLCANRRLKLGDFGIAKQTLAGRAATATAFAPAFVPTRMADGKERVWLPADDVYQVGQLLGMLLRGDPYHLMCEKDVRDLDCDDDLKRIISKAICPRKSRYPDAREMLRAMQGDGDHVHPPLESLAGKTVVFTGPLSITRFDAGVMVRQAGGSVADLVTARVDVVVQGGRSPLYRNGHKGDKLCEAEKLIRQGHPICIINEKDFKGLVGL
jgi:serine/threonine protein kinase